MSELPVECRLMLEHIHQFLDGEMTEREADQLRHHIDACDRCFDETDMIQALKTLVHRSCSKARAPEGLRMRIVTQITTVTWTQTQA